MHTKIVLCAKAGLILAVFVVAVVGTFGPQSTSADLDMSLYKTVSSGGDTFFFAKRLGGCYSFYDTVAAAFTAGIVSCVASFVGCVCTVMSIWIPTLLHPLGFFSIALGCLAFQLVAWVLSMEVHRSSYCEETDVFSSGKYSYGFWCLLGCWCLSVVWCVSEAIAVFSSWSAAAARADKQAQRRSQSSGSTSGSIRSQSIFSGQ